MPSKIIFLIIISILFIPFVFINYLIKFYLFTYQLIIKKAKTKEYSSPNFYQYLTTAKTNNHVEPN
ncbi:MAG: hypothetical protein ACQKHC_02750 [Candidatus Phytoplasma pruni]